MALCLASYPNILYSPISHSFKTINIKTTLICWGFGFPLFLQGGSGPLRSVGGSVVSGSCPSQWGLMGLGSVEFGTLVRDLRQVNTG